MLCLLYLLDLLYLLYLLDLLYLFYSTDLLLPTLVLSRSGPTATKCTSDTRTLPDPLLNPPRPPPELSRDSLCKLCKNDDFPIVTDFYRFFGLSWETSTLKNYHPEDSRHSGSGRIEFSSKSTTFLM